MATAPPYNDSMDCSVVHDALARGGYDDAAALEHSGSCPPCAELLAEEGALGRLLVDALPEPEGSVWRNTLADELQREGRSVARLPTWARASALAGSALLLCIATAWLAPRPDMSLASPGHMGLVLGGLVGVGLTGLGWALRPLHKPPLADGQRRWALGMLALGPLALMALPSGHEHLAGNELSALAVCFGVASAFGLIGVGVLRAVDRRRRWSWGRAAGYAAVGAVLGNLYLQLHCPYTGTLHTILAHGAVGLVWMVGLGLLGRMRD